MGLNLKKATPDTVGWDGQGTGVGELLNGVAEGAEAAFQKAEAVGEEAAKATQVAWDKAAEAFAAAQEAKQEASEIASKISTLPAGTELLWPGKTPPVGWIDASLNHGPLLRNTETWGPLWQFAESSGNIISEAAWLAEVARLGFCAAYSYGDGETTFRAPLLRKAFARAADPEAGLAVGAGHGDAIRPIVFEFDLGHPHATGYLGAYNLAESGVVRKGTPTPTCATGTSGAGGTSIKIDTSFLGSQFNGSENLPMGYVRLPIIKVYDTVYQPGVVEIQDLMNQLGAVANLVNSPSHLRRTIGGSAWFPDWSKKIGIAFTQGTPYTVPFDCWLFLSATGAQNAAIYMTVGGVRFGLGLIAYNQGSMFGTIALSKGDVITPEAVSGIYTQSHYLVPLRGF